MLSKAPYCWDQTGGSHGPGLQHFSHRHSYTGAIQLLLKDICKVLILCKAFLLLQIASTALDSIPTQNCLGISGPVEGHLCPQHNILAAWWQGMGAHCCVQEGLCTELGAVQAAGVQRGICTLPVPEFPLAAGLRLSNAAWKLDFLLLLGMGLHRNIPSSQVHTGMMFSVLRASAAQGSVGVQEELSAPLPILQC